MSDQECSECHSSMSNVMDYNVFEDDGAFETVWLCHSCEKEMLEGGVDVRPRGDFRCPTCFSRFFGTDLENGVYVRWCKGHPVGDTSKLPIEYGGCGFRFPCNEDGKYGMTEWHIEETSDDDGQQRENSQPGRAGNLGHRSESEGDADDPSGHGELGQVAYAPAT